MPLPLLQRGVEGQVHVSCALFLPAPSSQREKNVFSPFPQKMFHNEVSYAIQGNGEREEVACSALAA